MCHIALLFLYKMPVCFLLIIAALGLFNSHFRWSRLLIWGPILSIVSFLSGCYMPHLHLDKMLTVLGLVAVLFYGFNMTINMAIFGGFFSSLLLLLGQLPMRLLFNNIDFFYAAKTVRLWPDIGYNWLSAVFLLVIAMVFYGKKLFWRQGKRPAQGQASVSGADFYSR